MWLSLYSVVPVEFLHSITNTWTVGTQTYYRHKVIIKNVSPKPITGLKLYFESLTGSLWGLTPTQEKNTYEFPAWLKVLQPGSECTFVYIQGGSQAKITIQNYHWWRKKQNEFTVHDFVHFFLFFNTFLCCCHLTGKYIWLLFDNFNIGDAMNFVGAMDHFHRSRP